MFFDLTWKKIFCSRKWRGLASTTPPPFAPFLYGPAFGNKDGTTSGLIIHFKLPPRTRRFSSWLSSNESSVKWSEHTWTALDKTGLAIAFIQASSIFFLHCLGILRYETFFFRLDWFEQPFTHQVTIFVSSKVIFAKLWPEHS